MATVSTNHKTRRSLSIFSTTNIYTTYLYFLCRFAEKHYVTQFAQHYSVFDYVVREHFLWECQMVIPDVLRQKVMTDFFFLPHRFFMLKAVARSCEEHIFCFTHAPIDLLAKGMTLITNTSKFCRTLSECHISRCCRCVFKTAKNLQSEQYQD